MIGKKIRMKRICEKYTGRLVIIPMDHGVSSGPISGLVNMEDTISKVMEGGATAVVIHKGIAFSGFQKYGGDIGLILHLSASTKMGPDPNAKILVANVEEALQIGADAVSVHVNVGAETESEMLQDLGFISDECRRWQVPLLAMMYPRGPNVKDPFNVTAVKHAARLGAELGADIIKTNYTGSTETFKEVTRCCPVPVIVAGGPKLDSDKAILQMVYDAMKAGGAGISIGRNVFQHENITGMTRALARIILDDYEVEDAFKEITG